MELTFRKYNKNLAMEIIFVFIVQALVFFDQDRLSKQIYCLF